MIVAVEGEDIMVEGVKNSCLILTLKIIKASLV